MRGREGEGGGGRVKWRGGIKRIRYKTEEENDFCTSTSKVDDF